MTVRAKLNSNRRRRQRLSNKSSRRVSRNEGEGISKRGKLELSLLEVRCYDSSPVSGSGVGFQLFLGLMAIQIPDLDAGKSGFVTAIEV